MATRSTFLTPFELSFAGQDFESGEQDKVRLFLSCIKGNSLFMQGKFFVYFFQI